MKFLYIFFEGKKVIITIKSTKGEEYCIAWETLQAIKREKTFFFFFRSFFLSSL